MCLGLVFRTLTLLLQIFWVWVFNQFSEVMFDFNMAGLVGIRNQILKTRFTLNGERKMRYFTDVEQGDKEGGVFVCVCGGGGDLTNLCG